MNEPTAKNLWKHFYDSLNNSRLVRYLLLFALGWAIVQVLSYFQGVIVIFIFAAIGAFLLDYPARRLARFLPRTLAVTVVFLLTLLILFAFIGTIGFAILSQAESFLARAPQFLDSIVSYLEKTQTLLNRWNLPVDFEALEAGLRERAMAGIGFGFTSLQGIASNFLEFILIAVIAFFMLLDGRRIWDFLLKGFPESFRGEITEATRRNFLGFFWGRFLLSLFFGISVYIVFALIGLPYALVLATSAGVFDLVPGIGATIGISIVCLSALPQGIWLALKVLIGCVLLQQVEENLLMPRIMKGSIDLNPVFMFFALLVGARIAGLVGVFLSIPVAGVLVSLFDLREMRAGSDANPDDRNNSR